MGAPSDPALLEAMKRLRTKDRTEAEIRQRLLSRGFSEDDVQRVVAILQAKKWLSDERVAQDAVELARTRRPMGATRIRQELEQRGISDEVAQRAMGSLSETSETDRAIDLLHQSLGPEASPAKAARLLSRRGFDEEAIREALERFFPGLDSL